MTSARMAGRALLNAARVDVSPEQLAPLFAGVDEAALVALATTHRVAGLLHARLEGLDVLSTDSMDQLHAQRRIARARSLVINRTAEQLCDILDTPWAVVKGPALARFYAATDLRASSDLDLLVPRLTFRRVLEQLTAAGMVDLNKNWDAFTSGGVAEVPIDAGPVVIDLHWHLVALRKQRASIAMDCDSMVSRAEPMLLGATEVQTLNPIDTLVHLCAHAGLGGANLLVWLVDLDRFIRANDLAWPAAFAALRSAGLATHAAMVFRRLDQHLGTPLPDGFVAALSPTGPWYHVDKLLASRDRTDERLVAGWEAGLLPRTGRDSMVASLQAMGTEFMIRLRGRLNGERRLDWRIDAGGEAARQQWLDYVGSGAP